MEKDHTLTCGPPKPRRYDLIALAFAVGSPITSILCLLTADYLHPNPNGPFAFIGICTFAMILFVLPLLALIIGIYSLFSYYLRGQIVEAAIAFVAIVVSIAWPVFFVIAVAKSWHS